MISNDLQVKYARDFTVLPIGDSFVAGFASVIAQMEDVDRVRGHDWTASREWSERTMRAHRVDACYIPPISHKPKPKTAELCLQPKPQPKIKNITPSGPFMVNDVIRIKNGGSATYPIIAIHDNDVVVRAKPGDLVTRFTLSMTEVERVK